MGDYIIYYLILCFIIVGFSLTGKGMIYVIISIFLPLVFSKIHYGEWIRMFPIAFTSFWYLIFYFISFLGLVKMLFPDQGTNFRKTSLLCFVLSVFEIFFFICRLSNN
jgi:hypothetical protein